MIIINNFLIIIINSLVVVIINHMIMMKLNSNTFSFSDSLLVFVVNK